MSFVLNILKDIIHRMLQLLSFGKKAISNNLNIYIKTNTGNTLNVEVDPNWDIGNVKAVVAPRLGLEPDEVKIIFAGKELGDKITIREVAVYTSDVYESLYTSCALIGDLSHMTSLDVHLAPYTSEDCDLGQQSILHAIKTKAKKKLLRPSDGVLEEEENDCNRPLCETLDDSMFSNDTSTSSDNSALNSLRQETVKQDSTPKKVHFFVFCPTCKVLKSGKIRVRCSFCKSGAFTVHADPQNWNDVLEPKQISGLCENDLSKCADILNNREPTFAEFYFKCSQHASLGEDDEAVPLYLIRPNVREVPCLACADTSDTVFVFPCPESHVTCLDCFRQYCTTKLRERQFWQHPEFGYTLACPAGCPDSFIKEIHHFRLLTDAQYSQYHHFAAEEFVLQSGGVLCPQPGCGMGILADPECTKITCINGCGYVFCRLCLQGYHIGECQSIESINNQDSGSCAYNVNPTRAAEARWDEASKVAIKVLTKPCPKCRTPTERDGGCMHMVCTRAGCEFHWCWVCQTEWTRECMGSHWFG